MTEWMTRPVDSDALAMASASVWSLTVCISTPSKPTARASANRSCHDSSFGSIETSTARLMLTGASDLPRLDVTHRHRARRPAARRQWTSAHRDASVWTCGGFLPACGNASVSFRAVIFDFDGLIIDSETSIFDIWAEIYRDHGGELTMDQWRHALGTHNGFDPYAELLRQTGVQLSRETWVPRVRDEHWRRCEDEPLRPGVLDRLQEARCGRVAGGGGVEQQPRVGGSVADPSRPAPAGTRGVHEKRRRARQAGAGSVSAGRRAARRRPLRLRRLRGHSQRARRRARRRDVGRRRSEPADPHVWQFPAPHVTLESLAARTLAELQQDLARRT